MWWCDRCIKWGFTSFSIVFQPFQDDGDDEECLCAMEPHLKLKNFFLKRDLIQISNANPIEFVPPFSTSFPPGSLNNHTPVKTITTPCKFQFIVMFHILASRPLPSRPTIYMGCLVPLHRAALAGPGYMYILFQVE